MEKMLHDQRVKIDTFELLTLYAAPGTNELTVPKYLQTVPVMNETVSIPVVTGRERG